MKTTYNNEVAIFEREMLQEPVSTNKPFIQANTIASSLEEIKEQHVIPVFIKDNEPVISHADFIESMAEIAQEIYPTETILRPSVRLSHAIKGRIPEARNKPANQLLEHEKTLYYERMAFIIEIPSIADEIDGNLLSLTMGGVKAYNLDNLNNRKGADEHFKLFIGFKNTVCANLCIWTDGFMDDLKVKSAGQLKACIRTLVEGYNANFHLHHLRKLKDHHLSEQQFAHLIGRSRMYHHLPDAVKSSTTPLLLSDSQLSTVVKDYYRDNSFCRDNEGNINLWRLYNLLTSSNKSSYIDTFMNRSVNALQFVEGLRHALEQKETSWFLH